MRWEQLFDDLEGELAGAEAAERYAQVAERSRIELGLVTWADRLVATEGVVCLEVRGAGQLLGRVAAVGDGWLLLHGPPVILVPTDAVLAVEGLGRGARPAAGHDVARRLSLSSALRRLARDRSPIQVRLVDGRRLCGTVDAVAADHLDLAEHPIDVPRRATAVTRVRSVPLAALAVLTASAPTTLD